MSPAFFPSFSLCFLLQVVLLDHAEFQFALLSCFFFYYIVAVFSLLLLTFSKIGMEVGESRDNCYILSCYPDSSKGSYKECKCHINKKKV